MNDTRTTLGTINVEQLAAIVEVIRAAPDHANSDTVASVVERTVLDAVERDYEIGKLTRVAIEAVYADTGAYPSEALTRAIVTAVWDQVDKSNDPHDEHMHGIMPDDNGPALDVFPEDAPDDPRENGLPFRPAETPDERGKPGIIGQVHTPEEPGYMETTYGDTTSEGTAQFGVLVNSDGGTDELVPETPPITDISDPDVLADLRSSANLTGETPRLWAAKTPEDDDPDRLASSPQFGVPRHASPE